MNEIYDFTKITKCYKIYNIQACIVWIQESMNYLSVILMDINQNKIELIAFKNDIILLKEFKLSLNNWYMIKNIKTIQNIKFKRTQHYFKLKFAHSTVIENKKILKFFEK